MKLPSLLLTLVLAIIAAFTALNWNVFVTPTDLSLGVTMVKMPLGMVMLGLVVFITLLFLAFVVYLQTSVLLETRRHSREMQVNKELAEQAEASRFTELRNVLAAEMLKQANQHAESKATLLACVDQLGTSLRLSIEQSTNTLAAYIGEVEDRLEQNTTPPAQS
jgi:Na+-transporting methylmalonyl-CoA/oxaloacetate decarboxylase gamma subunit